VFFALHFVLILLVCFHDTFSIFSRSATLLPTALRGFWSRAADVCAAPLGLNTAAANPLRRVLRAYLNIAGIDAGYSYFAPNVPDSYKLVFELHYPDGHLEYELPQVQGQATGLRFATLLDEIAETSYEPLRAMMVKMVTYSVWQEHHEAVKIRAVLGYVELPSPADFRRGEKESYHTLVAYDFDFMPMQRKRH